MQIDNIIKQEIKKTIWFFLEGGITDKELIYSNIVNDFKVSKNEVIDIAKELQEDLPKKWKIF